MFNVGVDTEISFDDLICVGGEFEASSIVDDWSDSHSYQWSSESALILEQRQPLVQQLVLSHH